MFWNLGQPSVSQVDEERHIQVVREMVESNDYWHPTFLGGEPYYHKPPLKFWLAALVIEIFGESLSIHRAVDAFSGAITAVLVFMLVARLCGLAGGLYSVGALFSCQSLFLAHGLRDAVQDGLLVALTWGCFVLGSLLMQEGTSRRAEIHLLCGILGGLAALTKSVVGLLPLLSFVSYCLVHRRWDERAHLLRYFIPYVTIPLLYFIPHCILVDGAFEILVNYEILNRLFTGYHNSSNPYYYLELIAGGSYTPSLLLVIPTLLWAGYIAITGGRSPIGFLLWSSLVILLLASLARSRLPHYIYPALPPLSALCGLFVSNLSRKGSPLGSLCAGCALAVIAYGASSTVWYIVMRAQPSAVVRASREVGQAHDNTVALVSNQTHIPQNLARDIELHFTRTVQFERDTSVFKYGSAPDLLILSKSELQSKPVERIPRSYFVVPQDVAPDSSLLFVSYTSAALPTKPLQRFAGTELIAMSGYGWLRDRVSEQRGQIIAVATESSLIVPGDVFSEIFPVLLQLEVQVIRPSLAGAVNLEIFVNNRHLSVSTPQSSRPEIISVSLPAGVLRDGLNVLLLRQSPNRGAVGIGMKVRALSLKLFSSS